MKGVWIALGLTVFAGMAAGIGSVIAFMAKRTVIGILFGGVAGIMVYISLDELLPTSRAYGRGHDRDQWWLSPEHRWYGPDPFRKNRCGKSLQR